MSWNRLIWWCCVAFPVGAVFWQGCGGRVIQAQCADAGIAGMRYCVVTDYCCPTDTVCGTGQANAEGYSCPIGACCPPFDGGGDEITPPYINNPDYPGETMTGSNSPPPTGGVSSPPQPPQTRQ